MKKKCLIALLALWVPPALSQQGEWDPQPFWFGNDPTGNDATIAINLVHVWDGSTAKALALSADVNLDSRL